MIVAFKHIGVIENLKHKITGLELVLWLDTQFADYLQCWGQCVAIPIFDVLFLNSVRIGLCSWKRGVIRNLSC